MTPKTTEAGVSVPTQPPPGISDEAVMAANGELRRQERATGVTGLLVLVDASAILAAAMPHLRAELADEIVEFARSGVFTPYDDAEGEVLDFAAQFKRGETAARVDRGGATE